MKTSPSPCRWSIILRESDSSTCPQSTFTFSKAVPPWKTFLLSSVILRLCSLVDWIRTLPLCSVQSLLQDDQRQRLQHAHASAWWKEVPQLQPVQLLKHPSCQFEKTHAGSQWRETFQLQTVQLSLHNSYHTQETQPDTFRRKAFQLQTVQLLLHNSKWPKDTHAYPFRRKAFQLQTV